MEIPKIIAIDGPAASGKTTVGKKLADALGYLFFDTGVMYRALTWVALQRGFTLQDEPSITALSEELLIDIAPASVNDGRQNDVLADGQDITWDIRRSEVDANVSLVSSYSGVRQALSAQQRRIGLRGKVVMVGRDIGTVVLPEADLKIFLDASVEARARRRYAEFQEHNRVDDLKTILDAMRRRDQIDSTRPVAPLQPAKDSVLINTDQMNAIEVYQFILYLVKGSTE